MSRTERRQRIRKGVIFTSFLLFLIVMNYFSPYLIIEPSLVGIFVIVMLLVRGMLDSPRGVITRR